MALQEQILRDAYNNYFHEVRRAQEEGSYAIAAERILRPYDNYARTASDPSGDKLVSGKYGLAKTVFTTGLARGDGEQGLKDALSVYWMGATFSIISPHPTMSQEISSVVTGLSPAPLTGLFLQEYDTIPQAVNNLVSHLAQFTATVQVLITGLAKAGSPPPTITAVGKVS